MNATRVDRRPASSVPRRWFASSALVLATGLYAVGIGDLYAGSTWPDYLVIGLAALLSVAGFAGSGRRAADGSHSWVLLRNRTALGSLGALVGALALTWLRPPRDSSTFAVADSLLGYAQLLLLGLLCLCLASAFVSMRSFGAPEASRPGVVRMGSKQRILLRHYRVFPREPSIDVDEAGLSIWLPGIFGARPWLVPSAAVGVVDPSAWDDDELEDVWGHGLDGSDEPDLADPEPDWMTAQAFVVPFLATTSRLAAPNLALLFTDPQRVPPLRWLVSGYPGLSVRASRREPGLRLDGAELRAVDPVAAVEALLARGVERIIDPDEFIRRHREIVTEPERVAHEVALQRREGRLTLPFAVVAFLMLPAWLMLHDDRLVAAGVVAAMAAALVPRWVRHRE